MNVNYRRPPVLPPVWNVRPQAAPTEYESLRTLNRFGLRGRHRWHGGPRPVPEPRPFTLRITREMLRQNPGDFTRLSPEGSLPGFSGLGDVLPDSSFSLLNLGQGGSTASLFGNQGVPVFPSLSMPAPTSPGIPASGNGWLSSIAGVLNSAANAYSQVELAQGYKGALKSGYLTPASAQYLPGSSVAVAGSAGVQLSSGTKVLLFGGAAVALILVLGSGGRRR